jgi:glutamate-1-semialdehyde 2,1-aminomutase
MKDQGFFEELQSKIHETYAKKRPKSEKLHKEARSYMPGGDTRTVTFFRPFPPFMDHGEGCRLYDVDGNTYLDFGNNQTSLIHGHAHPRIVAAVTEQVKKGSVFPAPHEPQMKLAKIICDRLPSGDKVRFCNSGTEATMLAIRLARAYRKKYKLAKLEGGYHGSHDLVEISVKPPLDKAGPAERPNSVPEDVSIPPNVVKDCINLPFNNTEASVGIIEQGQADLAAVIMEPVQGSCGMVPADVTYLKALRDVTSRYGIPLIFDEVYTFRLARGGVQEMHNVIPDITALAKIIGGGYPVGACAGREQYMNLFSPLEPSFLTHHGTFNGNPVTMAAGIASLTELPSSAIDRLNRLGEKLRANFIKALQGAGIIAQVTGIGSLAQLHFTKEEVRDWRTSSTGRVDIRSLLQLMLMDKGIYPGARLGFNLSTPMNEKEIDQVASILKSCLMELKPYIEKAAPELIA